MVERELVRRIRKRFNQLYDDIVGEDYAAQDVEELLDELERNLLDELDAFEED